MPDVWPAFKKHWVVAVLVSIAVGIGGLFAFLAAFIAIWNEFWPGTFPQAVADVVATLSAWLLPVGLFVGMVAAGLIVILQIVILKEAHEDRKAVKDRDSLRAELENSRRDFALDRLKFLALFKLNQKTPTVQIRYVGHGADYALVQTIKSVLRDCLNWTSINLDGSNVPALRPDKHWKVIFDYTQTPVLPFSLFGLVAAAFRAGQIIDAPIGERNPIREDVHHLIIEVLPDGIGGK